MFIMKQLTYDICIINLKLIGNSEQNVTQVLRQNLKRCKQEMTCASLFRYCKRLYIRICAFNKPSLQVTNKSQLHQLSFIYETPVHIKLWHIVHLCTTVVTRE